MAGNSSRTSSKQSRATCSSTACTQWHMRGHAIVMRVHDEIVIDEPSDSGFTVADACALMGTLPAWADGLPFDADGYESDYYQKD